MIAIPKQAIADELVSQLETTVWRPNRLWLVAMIVLSVGVNGALSRVARLGLADWYQALAKPSFVPPDWAFAVAWTSLYALMAVSLWFYWRATADRPAAWRGGTTLFAVQYLTCSAWPFMFFGLQSTLLGFVGTLVLVPMIIATIILFGRYSRPAALALVPYLLWSTLAIAMSYQVWQLN
ncbi:MAG: tryptophan-rich sensory protein [Alphaproteobacteria bacterium]|nr:tryptophan-rich sensory protein [Alphaproteobacteria bacterium SS10]